MSSSEGAKDLRYMIPQCTLDAQEGGFRVTGITQQLPRSPQNLNTLCLLTTRNDL